MPSGTMHFYRSKREHHRCPKAGGSRDARYRRAEEGRGPGVGCGDAEAPPASSTALSLHSSAWQFSAGFP